MTDTSPQLVCVGDLMVDVLAVLPGPLARGSDTPAPISLQGGGAGANVAAWAAAAGAAVCFVGRVGDDAPGEIAVAQLRGAGVEVRTAVDPDRATGTCIVLIDPAGERTMVPSAGANDAPLDVSALPETAAWLYLSGYLLLRAASRASALDAIALARARGWSVAVDAASAAPLRAVGSAEFLGWLDGDVLLFANAAEARVLTGLVDPARAAVVLAARLGQAVVKLGAGGAIWSDGRRICSMPVAKVTAALDTTGAGDAVAAGFLAGTGSGAHRLAQGLRLAAQAVAQVGARPPQPASDQRV